MPRACATGSSCSTSDAARPPRSTGANVQRNLPRLGARQRQDLIDQPLQLVDLLELADERRLLQPRRVACVRSASSISPRSAASGVRSSWASAALNWRISPTACSSARQRLVERLRHLVELVVRRRGPAAAAEVARRRCARAAAAMRASGASATPDSHRPASSGDAAAPAGTRHSSSSQKRRSALSIGASDTPTCRRYVAAAAAGDHAVGDANTAVVGLDVVAAAARRGTPALQPA